MIADIIISVVMAAGVIMLAAQIGVLWTNCWADVRQAPGMVRVIVVAVMSILTLVAIATGLVGCLLVSVFVDRLLVSSL